MSDDGQPWPPYTDRSGDERYGITFGSPQAGPPPGAPPLEYTTGPGSLMGPAATNRLRTHAEGTTILVLGIVSVVICPLVGPLALSMGNKAMADVRHSGYVFRNAGIIRAGRLLGFVATALLVLGVLVFTLAFCSALNSDSSDTPSGQVRSTSLRHDPVVVEGGSVDGARQVYKEIR